MIFFFLSVRSLASTLSIIRDKGPDGGTVPSIWSIYTYMHDKRPCCLLRRPREIEFSFSLDAAILHNALHTTQTNNYVWELFTMAKKHQGRHISCSTKTCSIVVLATHSHSQVTRVWAWTVRTLPPSCAHQIQTNWRYLHARGRNSSSSPLHQCQTAREGAIQFCTCMHWQFATHRRVPRAAVLPHSPCQIHKLPAQDSAVDRAKPINK